MVPSLRRALFPWMPLALAGTPLMAWMGLQGFAFSDYDREAAPAYLALAHGHVGSFLSLAPAYGGSLIMRSPFAMFPNLWGGGELAVFRAAAVPCLLAAIALGLVLVAQNLARGLGRGTCAMVLLLCAGNPITWRAIEMGHPEELLGGVLCVGAVLAGIGRKPGWAGLLLGLAIANKAWAVLAIGPVLLALPAGRWARAGDRRRRRLPLHAPAPARRAGHRDAPRGERQRHDLPAVAGLVVPREPGPAAAERSNRRSAPAWLSPIPHPLIVALAVPLSLLAARRRADPLAREWLRRWSPKPAHFPPPPACACATGHCLVCS